MERRLKERMGRSIMGERYEDLKADEVKELDSNLEHSSAEACITVALVS